MRSGLSEGKIFASVFLLIVCLHGILVLSTRLFPFIDLPNHLAAATILKDRGDTSNSFSDYYITDTWLQPNVFYLLFCSAKIFPSVETANRAFMIAYVILLPLSVLTLIRKLGGNPWFSLLSFLLIYNYNTAWGFVGFMFSIPLVLLFYSFLPGYLETGRPILRALIALLLVSLFFVHLLSALFALFLFLICLSCRRGRPLLWRLDRLAPAVPLACVTLFWWRTHPADYGGQGLGAFLRGYYSGGFFSTFAERKGLLLISNHHLVAGPAWMAAALVFSLGIVLPFLWLFAVRIRRRHAGESIPLRPCIPLLAGSLACYFLLPHQIPAQTILYQRFAVYVLLSLAVTGAVLARRGLGKSFYLGLCVLAAVHLGLWSDYFTSFNRENSGFTEAFFPPNRRGARLAGMICDHTFRERPVYIHFPGYYITWRRGIACTSIIDFRFGTVRRRKGYDALPKYLEWIGRTGQYDGRYGSMEYLLLRESPGASCETYPRGFEPVKREGRWALYRNTKNIDKHGGIP